MATYLSLSDLVDTIGASMVLRLLDDDKDGVADAGAVERVLTSAEREAAGYVSTKMQMAAVLANPAATDHLRSIAVHVAVEHAYRRRPEFLTRDGTPYVETYKRELQKLKDIAAGKYRLDTNGTPAAPATSGGEIAQPAQVTASGGLIVVPLGPGTFTGGFGGF